MCTWKIQNTKHKTWFQWTVASFFGMNLMVLGYGISFSPPRHWIPATLKSKGPYEKHGFALWRKHAFGWSLKTNRAKLKLGVLNVKPCAGSTYCDGREERLFATRRWLWVTAQMQKMQSCFVVRLLWNCYIYMAEARIMLCQHVVFAPLSCWGMIARNGYILLSLLPKGILEEIWEDLYTCYIDSISIYLYIHANTYTHTYIHKNI